MGVFPVFDPDPVCESASVYGSMDPIESGSDPDSDPGLNRMPLTRAKNINSECSLYVLTDFIVYFFFYLVQKYLFFSYNLYCLMLLQKFIFSLGIVPSCWAACEAPCHNCVGCCAELVVIPHSQFVRSCLPSLGVDTNGVECPEDQAPLQAGSVIHSSFSICIKAVYLGTGIY